MHCSKFVRLFPFVSATSCTFVWSLQWLNCCADRRQMMCDDEYARVAHDLVDIAVNRALALLVDTDWCDVSLDEYIVPADVKRRTPVEKVDERVPSQPNVLWPTIEEFTPDVGTERILDFVKVLVSLILLYFLPFTKIICSIHWSVGRVLISLI